MISRTWNYHLVSAKAPRLGRNGTDEVKRKKTCLSGGVQLDHGRRSRRISLQVVGLHPDGISIRVHRVSYADFGEKKRVSSRWGNEWGSR